MLKKLKIWIGALLVMLTLSGCCISHDWQPATCTIPETCAKCEKTRGEPVGHIWKDATCTKPKYCEKCGEEEGDPAPHVSGDWIREAPDYVTALVWEKMFCTVCENQIDSRIDGALQSLTEDEVFLFSPEEFGKRLCSCLKSVGKALKRNKGEYTIEIKYDDSGILFYEVSEGPKEAFCGLLHVDDKLPSNSDHSINEIFVSLPDNNEEAVEYLVAILITCDPSIEDESESVDIAEEILVKALSSKPYSRNGIIYWFSVLDEGGYALTITPR